MSYSKNGFLATGTGGGSSAAGAGLVVSTRTRTSGDVAITSTTYVDVDATTDVTVAAKSGDYVSLNLSALVSTASTGIAMFVDVVTVISGSPVTYVSGNGSTGEGIPSWRTQAPSGTTLNLGIGPEFVYQVQGADLSSGSVTFRLRARISSAGTQTFSLGTTRNLVFTAKNLSTPIGIYGGVFGSPSIGMPQGTRLRQWTFDDTNGFTNDVGSISSVSGRLQLTSPGNNNLSALEPSGSTSVADGEVWADVYPLTPDNSGQYDVGILFRVTDANNHYLVALRQGTTGSASSEFELYKKVSGTYTSIRGSIPVTTYNSPMAISGTAPIRVMVRFVGSQISVFCDEVLVLASNDATYSTGRVGVRAAGSTGGCVVQFDNLTVYTLPSTWTRSDYSPQNALLAPQYQIPTAGQINYAEVTSASGGTLTNQTWSTINLDTIVTDPGGLYNTSTKQYTVPANGTYLINMVFRADAAAGSNVGFAVHTSNVDSAATVWRQDYAGTGNRHSYNYVRVGKFNAGDQLRAFAYVDVAGTTTHGGATMTIQQVATSSTVASASILPETVSTANTGTSYVVPDPAVATISNLTMTGNVTFTFPTAAAGKSFTLALTQDATGSRTAVWPATVKWPSAVTPSLSTAAGKIDLLTFVCVDGTNWLGALASKGY